MHHLLALTTHVLLFPEAEPVRKYNLIKGSQDQTRVRTLLRATSKGVGVNIAASDQSGL